MVGLFVRGLNFSIEFKGGSRLEFQDKSGAGVQEFQAIMARFGLPDARVELVGGQNCPTGCIQIRAKSLTELGLTPAVSPSPSATPTTGPSAASPTPTASATPQTPGTLRGDQLRAELARVAGISPNDITEQAVAPPFGTTIARK